MAARNYVVGSGPAGVSAAVALLDQGLPVTVLDAGGDLEPEIQDRVSEVGARPPDRWQPEEVDALRGRLRYNSEGAPLKLRFGSDYAYRDVDRFQPIVCRGAEAYRAFAAGGLSSLWGAAILPYNDDDLEGWPIGSEELREHYAAALEMTGLSADHDELEARYPLHVEPRARMELSSQARVLLRRMRAHSAALESRNIHFGQARHAVGASRSKRVDGCVYCGMCLYGCPYGLIYSANDTLRDLLTSAAPGMLRYASGFVVHRLRERERHVEISTIARSGGERTFEASRVYLAGGVFSSTRILLESAEVYDQPLTLRQSDHFLVPLLVMRRSGDLRSERLHTLSQLFLEVQDPALTRHAVHLQIYTYNDFLERMARDRLGALFGASAPLTRPLLQRLIVAKGYLHSDESSTIRVSLRRSRPLPVLHVEGVRSASASKSIRGVIRLLRRSARHIGAMPLGLGLRIGLPGSGVHVGGSYPMAAQPTGFESDLEGRPPGFRRVHVVDSSVFPTVPAPTITLSIMANAHRIASLSARQAVRSSMEAAGA
jgi:choline dehydrogenase-like flavoprotein